MLASVSSVLVALHKEHFGRGPTKARAHFAGPDALVCVMRDALLPAERRLIDLGEGGRVRDARGAFQAATAKEFIAAVEDRVGREVVAFASGIDVDTGVVFENFVFLPRAGDAGR